MQGELLEYLRVPDKSSSRWTVGFEMSRSTYFTLTGGGTKITGADAGSVEARSVKAVIG